MKKFLSYTMILLLVLSSTCINVYANVGSEEENAELDILSDYEFDSKELTNLQKEKLTQEIIEQIGNVFGENYSFENFEWEIEYFKRSDNTTKFYVTLSTDMTLVKNATEMPYYKGLSETLKSSVDPNERNTAQTLIDEYVEEVNSLYFNKPYRTMFRFEVEILNSDLESITNENMIYNISYISEDGLYPLDTLKLSDGEAVNNGKQAVQAITALNSDHNEPLGITYSSYDRLGARDYAINHFYDHHGEYSSNCANFVSYCLNQGGGLPQTSSWYPGSLNWIRTGYNGSEGVCIHVNNNENFAWTSNRSIIYAGCIVSWNAYSHVGLTTYGDGSLIRFSAHTTDKQDVYLPTSENVSFYRRPL